MHVCICQIFGKCMTDGSSGETILVEKEQVHARIPPELLVHIDMSVDILKSFYLLPSVMHRLESLMLASQLRLDIGCSDNNTNISSSLVSSFVPYCIFSIDGCMPIFTFFLNCRSWKQLLL